MTEFFFIGGLPWWIVAAVGAGARPPWRSNSSASGNGSASGAPRCSILRAVVYAALISFY